MNTNTSKRSILIVLALVITFAPFISLLTYDTTVNAANALDFRADRIIDDDEFTKNTSMSAAQIQDFLNRKNSTCLKSFTTYSITDDNGDGVVQDSTTEKYGPDKVSAARAIKSVADIYGINPKVLLVTLQKEQGLITRSDCPSWRYNTALGYGCPDEEPCDNSAFGFSKQLDYGAYHFRGFFDDTLPSVPYGLGDNRIYWHPDKTRCGSSIVNIKTRGTAALYNYTPYRPNQTALNAGYGEGNSCSSYGNRNFFLFYTDWFGSPTGPSIYDYSVVSKEAYSDANYTNNMSTPLSIKPNESAYVKVTVKNTGNQPWIGSNLRLGTWPPGRSSVFVDDSWIAGNRPTSMEEASVVPEDNATFKFKITAPAELGTYNESFDVLIEGSRWFEKSFTFPITVETPDPYYAAKASEFAVFSDSGRTKKLNNAAIATYPETKLYARVKVKNTGNRSFAVNLTKLGTSEPLNRTSPFSDTSWTSASRPGVITDSDLDPGETATFEFTMTAPSQLGTYVEQFGLVIEGQRWVETDLGVYTITVKEKPEDQLTSGEMLLKYDMLRSANERYRLIFQGDGNLVLYDGGKALWSSRTGGSGSGRLIMQGDGNLVLYNGGKAVWSSRTVRTDTTRLILQGDGNLVLYTSDGKATWSSGTRGR